MHPFARPLASFASVFTASVVFAALPAPASAIDVSGDQSGVWTLANSPYRMVADVRVPPGQTLTIEAGVRVVGLANVKLTVDQATLTAIGTLESPIIFTAENQTAGWRGIRITSASNATTLSRCIFDYAKGTGAYPEVRGGAIYVVNCSPTFSHNFFRANLSQNGNFNGCGGGICAETSSAVITDNTFTQNQADSGAAIAVFENGTPLIARNVISSNSASYAGGGIYCGARSSPIIENNIIAANTSGGWGGGGVNAWTVHALFGFRATVRNNLFVNNVAGDAGGGLYCRYGNTQMSGNTFVGNRAARGGAVYAVNQASSQPVITSGILWNNTAPQGPEIFLEPSTGSIISVNYSDVQGGWSGVGNVDLDPAFRSPNGPDGNPATWQDNDYHLADGSPCSDAGDPSYVPAPGEVDLDGEERIINGRIDMGVDESAGGVPCEAVKKLSAQCTNGTLIAQVKLKNDQYDGQSLGLDVNGEGYTSTIKGKKAKLKLKNRTGLQTITLSRPADCVAPKAADCG